VYFNNNKVKTSNGILQIDDNFASLVNVTSAPNQRDQFTDNELYFEFTYRLSQIKAIEENSYSVGITIKTKNQSRPNIVPSRKLGDIDTDKLLDNILSYNVRSNNIRQEEKNDVIAIRQSDITAKINNQILPLLKSNLPLDNVGFQKNKLVVTRIEQKQSDESQVSGITRRNVGHVSMKDTTLDLNSDSPFNSKEAIIDLIKNKSLAPSVVTETTDRALGTNSSLGGLLRKSRRPEYVGSPLSKLVNSYIFQGQNSNDEVKYITSVEQTFDDTITVKARVPIKNNITKSIRNQFSSIVIVKFELLQTLNESDTRQIFPVEIVEKELNIEEHLKNYFLPSLPPTVAISKTNSNVILQIKQNDDKSNGALIYKKTFSINDKNFSMPYTLIDKVNLSKENGIMQYSFANLNDENAIYRIVPFNRLAPNFIPSIFTDVLLKNKPQKAYNRKLVIVPRLTEKGVIVSAFNTFFDVVSARLLIRNVTLRQKKYLTVNDVFNFSSNNSDSSLLLNRNLIPYHIYELTTKIIEKNGVETMSSYSTFFEYVPFVGNPFSVSISDVSKTNGDVQFTVNADLIQDQIGVFRVLLDSVNADYDDAALAARKSNYDKFISFSIIRHNITTGDVENLGIIPNGITFLDSNRSKQYSAKHLTYDNQYMYMIYPLVREPETVISQSREVRDVETRKKYNINPRKHLHPLTLTRGNIISKKVIEDDSDPKDDNLYGYIGISYKVDASLVPSKPSITNFDASLMADDKIYLTWTIQGDQNLIDHLIVLSEVDSVRKIIGKCHTFTREKSTFSYKLSKDDVGHVKFILIPVFSDFSSGRAAVSLIK